MRSRWRRAYRYVNREQKNHLSEPAEGRYQIHVPEAIDPGVIAGIFADHLDNIPIHKAKVILGW